MNEIIKTNPDSCTGCNRCVRECPMEMANITYQDAAGNIKVKLDSDKCINCGRCFSACKHNARYFEDDTSRFFDDLSAGIPISVITAPSIRTNIPEYKRVLTCLKTLGVNKVYDVSLGADICIWAHIRHMESTGYAPLIAQPCPVIVKYIEVYRHDLIDSLSPVHSPMACTSIYMKHYEGITDRIAALSPCIAKSHELGVTGFAEYNVTFMQLNKYLADNGVELPGEETGFDHPPGGIGTLFPMPGGLKENIEYYTGKKLSIDTAEGFDIFDRLDAYADTPSALRPHIFDVLNCDEGCNIGTAGCTDITGIFSINRVMDEQRDASQQLADDKERVTTYNFFDENLDLSLFMRQYRPITVPFPHIGEENIADAFKLLGKTTVDAQNVDCGACGNPTCRHMARKIALGVSIPLNCLVKVMEDAKAEHEENIAAHKREMLLLQTHEEDEFNLTKLHLVIRASKIGLWDMEVLENDPVNPENPFTWSDEFRHLLGYEDENDFPNLLGSFTDRLHPEDLDKTNNALIAHLLDKTGKTPYDVEYRCIKKNGECAYYRAMGETIRDIDGNPLRVAGAIMDITADKMALLEMQRLKDEAERANKSKSAFLSTMSHEIRTPMNAILGITEILLQSESVDDGVRASLEKIYSSGDMLLSIINDILDLSKIEAGKLELIPDRYEIASLLSDTAQLNIMRIGSKQIEFELCVDADVPVSVIGDELRVKQILNNLLSNAFKYTAQGKVKLSVSVHERKPDSTTLAFVISDTGQGMSKEQVDTLFNEYTRFNLEANRTTEGTGLGMSITRNLLRLMNGEIQVESEKGKGSVFTAYLPQKKVGDEVLGEEMVKNLHNFRTRSHAHMKRVQITREPMPYGSVLVVDDVEMNIFVAKGLLARYQLKIDSAQSGYQAIEMLRSGKSYDIVFMDHMMPDMDGVETTKRIREMGYIRPIVALTANAVSGQAEIFLSNGFDDFISKPIDIRQLNNVLNKLIRDKQPPEVVEKARRSAQIGSDEDDGVEALEPEGFVITPQIAEVFIRDASKTIAVLDGLAEKQGNFNEDEMRSYIINTHGIKTALANIGETKMSADALKLEMLGRDGNTNAIAAETPAFLSALKAYVEKLKQSEQFGDTQDEDPAMLREKLLVIHEACENFDSNSANSAMQELQKKTWSKATREKLAKISEYLLHSDFEEAGAAAAE